MKSKGNLPIVLLVMGVFALCSLALLTFLIADFKTNNSFVGIGKMFQLQEDLDEYSFLVEKGASETFLEQRYNLTEESGVKYFYLEEQAGGSLFKKGVSRGDLLFSVEYAVPS